MSSIKAAAAAGSKASSLWYGNAAKASQRLSNTPIWNSVWLSRILLALQTIAVPLAFWFKPICVCIALVWLVIRASQVLNKPLEELSSLLGFDIPATPLIDLASIKADGAVIHWTLPEKPRHKSQLKYQIHLNGALIDNVSILESAVTITGLQPGAFYLVRVALVHHEFSSKSPAIRFRTKPAESGDFFNLAAEGHETDSDAPHHSVPRVRPYRALRDFTPASPTSAPMAREASSGLGAGKMGARRPSPAALGVEMQQHDSPPNETEQGEGAETIQQLTEKLDAIRRETEEAEKQAKEEEEEEFRQKDELTKERDELKMEANEKEKASRNLKREVNTLERQNTAAQNERAKQERLLQQKRQERQKLKDDMVRWERGAGEMLADVERINEEKTLYLDRIAQEKESLRAKLADETARTRAVDDEVKEKTTEIKKLEREMKDFSPAGTETDPSLVQQLQLEAEEERRWQTLKHSLQQQYQMAFNKVDAAKRFHAEQARYLESLRAERRRQDEMVSQFAAAPTLDRAPPRRGDSQRSRNAQQHRLSVSDSPRMAAFAAAAAAASAAGNPGQFPGSINTGAFNSRFFNIQNGMTMGGAPTDEVAMSDDERDRLTGGAAMSPSAGADLIPADLFSGDGDHNTRPLEHVQPLPGLGSLPGLPGIPAPRPQSEHAPASPTASSSRSPSVLASPQASQHNLQLGSPENIGIDADRRSIRSTRSNRAPSGGATATAGTMGSRFGGMFGIKQRAKNNIQQQQQQQQQEDNDAAAAGGLPLGKASSMPRQDQGIPGLDSAGRRRNSSISGVVAFGAEGDLEGPAAPDGLPTASSSRKGAFGFFSKDKSGGSSGGWPSTFTAFGRQRPSSPRPGSTHSNELPRPSIEGGSRWRADAWPASDVAAAGARGSPLAFGSGWTAPSQSSQSQQQTQQQQQQSRLFGSRHPSRRPSVQYGAGPPEDILEDDDSDVASLGAGSMNLAPIGTKPAAGAKKAGAGSVSSDAGSGKLNPNAKDFKSFFSSMKFGGNKNKESSAASASGGVAAGDSSEKDSASVSTASNLAAPASGLALAPADTEESSPPNSRKSRDTRDTRSMTTTESSLAPSESGRASPTEMLVRTPSYSNTSDVAAASPSLSATPGAKDRERESFMQKISRKSSSSKFSLPTFKREKSRLDTAALTSTPTAEEVEVAGLGVTDEGGLSESVGSLRERERDRASMTRNWSSAFKIGKGGKKGAGGESAMGTASGTEDGEDEEEV